jgi:hypothetical protein
METSYFQLGISALTGLGGVLIGYGIIKEKVSQAVKTNDDQERRILALEARGLRLIFKEDCTESRTECRDSICTKFEEVKELVKENRNIVAVKFDEISQFMGWVKAKLEGKVGTHGRHHDEL